jgi:hypothetical protein
MYISPSVVLPNVQSLQSHRPLLRVCTVVPLCPCFSRCASDSCAFHCPLLSTFKGQPTDYTYETAIGDSGIDRLTRALGLGSSSTSANKSSSRPFKKRDIPSLAQCIQLDAFREIHLMVSLILNRYVWFFEPDLCTKAWCRCGVRRRRWPVIGL